MCQVSDWDGNEARIFTFTREPRGDGDGEMSHTLRGRRISLLVLEGTRVIGKNPILIKKCKKKNVKKIKNAKKKCKNFLKSYLPELKGRGESRRVEDLTRGVRGESKERRKGSNSFLEVSTKKLKDLGRVKRGRSCKGEQGYLPKKEQ